MHNERLGVSFLLRQQIAHGQVESQRHSHIASVDLIVVYTHQEGRRPNSSLVSSAKQSHLVLYSIPSWSAPAWLCNSFEHQSLQEMLRTDFAAA
jgi:hypothetical protein